MFKILLVEDDLSTSKLMNIILKRAGFDVINAFDGVQALEFMDKKYVDLIVLDLMLPKMDGFEFASLLRQNNNKTPILMVTAKNELDDKISTPLCKAYGHRAYNKNIRHTY